MNTCRRVLFVAVALSLVVSTSFANAVTAYLSEKEAQFFEISTARISTGAQFDNNVILFVQPESQAMWKAPEDMEGYLYMMVRSGTEATGMEMIIPQILYEVKIDGRIVEMKAINNPSVLRVMVGKFGVYTGWIRSYDPVKIPKDASIIVTSWVDWGVVCLMAVTPLEVPEPLPLVQKAAPRSAEQVFAGQSKEAAQQEVNDIPDRVLEKANPIYLAAKDIQENSEVKLNKNQLDFAKSNAEATWIVQGETEGYMYLKVVSGPSGSEGKYLKPELQYEVKIDGIAVPMKLLKSNAQLEESRYKADQPAGWIRSDQMVRLTPGCTVSVKAKSSKTSVYQTVVSTSRIAVE